MTSRIRRWRGVRPLLSAGPSGSELTDAGSPSWAATSAFVGRPRRRAGRAEPVDGLSGVSSCAMHGTLGMVSDTFKHLFERVAERPATRRPRGLVSARLPVRRTSTARAGAGRRHHGRTAFLSVGSGGLWVMNTSNTDSNVLAPVDEVRYTSNMRSIELLFERTSDPRSTAMSVAFAEPVLDRPVIDRAVGDHGGQGGTP